ncbi:ribose-5-phosphate isomerase RpiA [Saliterribacillus persicus]|uniref:Ribose-5-phosphate isomerase A n=1 Tax=Saliterribacillus persicus TaxID=930114 RepID=A0A368Y1T6_9BACI|nr:ribose-5-phosphate isomerase RpiA [Saliterribacillus persicus]RCW73258.1 ribose-5-phosphate isomerase [Saliterribacillus persicus]
MEQTYYEKKEAGEAAVDLIHNKMVIGLGTGSTVYHTINKLGEKMKDEKLDVTCVSTSSNTTEFAKQLGIKLVALNDVQDIDLTIDGADEIDGDFRAIKGGGGALLFEKIVASSSRKVAIIVDSTKYVDTIGAYPLPVEVLPFGYKYVFERMVREGFQPNLRKMGNDPFITDSGNFILDINVSNIIDKVDTINLEKYINNIPGVIENGLFTNIVDVIYIGKKDGVEVKNREKGD